MKALSVVGCRFCHRPEMDGIDKSDLRTRPVLGPESCSELGRTVPISMTKRDATVATSSSADALLSEADRLYSLHRNDESLVAIAQALEIALARYASSVLMPASARDRSTPAERQLLRKRYMTTIGNVSLGSLRNVVVHLLLREMHPAAMSDALLAVEQAKHFKRLPTLKEQFAACQDGAAQSTAEALRDLSIIDLRSAVVHEGYKPTDAEIEEHRVAVTKIAHALEGIAGR